MTKQSTAKRKKKLRKIFAAKKRELEELKKLRLTHPDLYKRCGRNKDQPCCQATNLDGSKCSREALTSRTYIRKVKCCLLCWQHSTVFGLYGLFKVAQMAAESSLDWDTYCVLHPAKCESYFKKDK